MLRVRIIASIWFTVLSGCAVSQAHRSQDQIRCALLDLYTDQVMDNLIRAHNRMPIVQLDYTQAQGMITLKNTGSIGDSQSWTKNTALSLPVLAKAVTRTTTNVLNAAAGLENTNQITISAVPVTTANEVYDAYLQFLTLPDSLIETASPPPAGTAHICRQYGDTYFWVPTAYRDKFFELALLSTVQRGKSLVPPDQFYTANVTDLIGEPEPVGVDPQAALITLKLDKKIPNDDGYLVFIDPAAQEPPPQYPFEKYSDLSTGTASMQVPRAVTDRIKISYEKAKVESLRSQLLKASKAIKVRLHHNQPSPPSTEDLLQRANFQLQQFNQNVVRQAG